MKSKQETGTLNTLGAVLLGMILCQVLATVHVYLSNQNLYETISAITKAGYVPVPNMRVAIHLKDFSVAFWGGLFFTLSLGCGLSVFSFGSAYIWDQMLGRNRIALILLILSWLIFLAALNVRGIQPLVTSYFLVIPPAVFWISLKGRVEQSREKSRLMRITYLFPIVGLALLLMWVSKTDGNFFINVRDNLLLSNPVGKKINDAYYRYTLYPAEVFKSLDQKILKTGSLRSVSNPVSRRLENALLYHDYLLVNEEIPADLTITMSDGFLVFSNRGKTVLKASPQKFFNQHSALLKRFSIESDPYALFRQATFWSLLIGLPIVLYVFVFSVLRFITGFYMEPGASSILTASLCFLLGLALSVPLIQSKGMTREIEDISQALSSRHWQKRVAALKMVTEKRLEIGDFPAYRRVLLSTRVPERYWLAKALGVSRRAETYPDLLSLWDDPSRNVVCMVYEGLGRRGDRRVVEKILERLKKSEDWYVQGYAYKSLRRLGWKQKKSK